MSLNTSEKKQTLKEMFDPAWYQTLEPFLQSPMFKAIGTRLLTLANTGVEISPKFPDTFRAFKECSWTNLKVVMLGISPQPGRYANGKYVADGLAFSSRDSIGCPKTLELFLNGINKDIYKGKAETPQDDFDLSRLARQGVLLLNCALSLPVGGKLDAHFTMWAPFIKFVLQTINDEKDNISVIFFGNLPREYKHMFTNQSFQLLETEHPVTADACHRDWDHRGVFSACNAFQELFGQKIVW